MKYLLIFLLLAIPAFAAGDWLVVDDVVAKVDTAVITLTDVRFEALAQNIDCGENDKDFAALVRALASRKLVAIEAEKMHLPAERSEMDNEYERLYKSAGGREAFLASVAQKEIPVELVERSVRDLVLNHRYAEIKRKTTYVSEVEVREYIQNHPMQFKEAISGPAYDRVREILAEDKYQSNMDKWYAEQDARGRVRFVSQAMPGAGFCR